jgi:soluble lytic murein transglycosylase
VRSTIRTERAPTARRGAPTGARRRRAVRRRRRTLAALALLACGALAGLVVLALPLIRHAESEFGLPLSYQDIIRRQAAERRLDPALLAAVIYAETKFDARTSSAGAEGLMQIEPQTAKYLAHISGGTRFAVSDLWNPAVNIAYGSYYLRVLLDQFHGSVPLALAAYNAGAANVQRWLAAAVARHSRLTVDAIPFPETRDYVQRVLDTQRDYRRAYAVQLGYGPRSHTT